MAAALVALGGLTALGALVALLLWPSRDPEVVEHTHHLPPNHPHVRGAVRTEGGFRHAHAFVIDDDHRHWPA